MTPFPDDMHTKWRITIPTIFTLLRIGLTPIIVRAMVHHNWNLSCILFGAAALSDVIDGALARLLNMRSLLGACLDAFADKFLLVSCFTTLAFVETPFFSVPRWFVLLIVCKELLLMLGALIIYCIKGTVEIKPTVLGKGTTFVQICFIMWFFTCYFFHWFPIKTYSIILGLLIVLMVVSFIQYVVIGTCFLRTRRKV